MSVYEAIKERISIDDYARTSLGLTLHKDGDGWRCKSFRADSENSTVMHISNGMYHDFGTGSGGDVITLCAESRHGGNKWEAVKELAALCGLSLNDGDEAVYRHKVQGLETLAKMIEHWHNLLTVEDRAYFHKRGITDETIDALKFGRADDNHKFGIHDKRLVFPYFKGGKSVYFISRSNNGTGCYREDGCTTVYDRENGVLLDVIPTKDKTPEEIDESLRGYSGDFRDGAKYKKATKNNDENTPLEHCAWGLDSLSRINDGKPVIIAEGMFDALSFWQEGYPVLSPITGRFSKEQYPEILNALRAATRQGARVVMVFDNDSAGAEFRVKMADILFRAGIKFDTVRVPSTFNGEEIKDVSDYYQRGGDLREFTAPPDKTTKQVDNNPDDAELKTAAMNFDRTSGLAYMVRINSMYGNVCDAERDAGKAIPNAKGTRRYVSKEAAKKAVWQILRTAGRYRHDELEEHAAAIGEELSTLHGPNKAKELVKKAQAAPNDAEAAKWVEEKHSIIFSPNSGPYIYEHGVWKRRTEAELKGLIGAELGKWKCSALINAGLNVLLADTVISDVKFNKRPIWNFRNGTFDLETGTFSKKHSEADYSTVQTPYDYDPEADCPRWKEFIYTVAAGDKLRIQVLQEMAGSIFCADSRFQRCYMLKGEGRNGKSVYLNVIEAMCGGSGSDAVSNVPFAGMDKDFQIVRLDGAIVNISAELSTNISGAALELSNFREAIGGGSLQGCHKHKPHYSFQTRAKFFYACNDYPQIRDTSNGTARRLLFVSFPVMFSHTGKKVLPIEIMERTPDDDKARYYSEPLKDDNTLEAVLMKELSGIWNWAYQGYLRLMERGMFIDPKEHVEMMREFRLISNPVRGYLDDDYEALKAIGTIKRPALYKRYKDWCDENGHKPLSSHKLSRDITRAAQDKGVVCEPIPTIRSFTFR